MAFFFSCPEKDNWKILKFLLKRKLAHEVT
jgi:hypothetical protein